MPARTDKGDIVGKLSDDGQICIFLGVPNASEFDCNSVAVHHVLANRKDPMALIVQTSECDAS